eukprot:188272_1
MEGFVEAIPPPPPPVTQASHPKSDFPGKVYLDRKPTFITQRFTFLQSFEENIQSAPNINEETIWNPDPPMQILPQEVLSCAHQTSINSSLSTSKNIIRTKHTSINSDLFLQKSEHCSIPKLEMAPAMPNSAGRDRLIEHIRRKSQISTNLTTSTNRTTAVNPTPGLKSVSNACNLPAVQFQTSDSQNSPQIA